MKKGPRELDSQPHQFLYARKVICSYLEHRLGARIGHEVRNLLKQVGLSSRTTTTTTGTTTGAAPAAVVAIVTTTAATAAVGHGHSLPGRYRLLPLLVPATPYVLLAAHVLVGGRAACIVDVGEFIPHIIIVVVEQTLELLVVDNVLILLFLSDVA